MLRPWNLNMEVVRGSATPIHIQIAETIIDEIQRGRFLPGSVLPGTRELSNQLSINRKTVVQAYDELISKGWLTTESKRGTFVSSRGLMVNHQPKTIQPDNIQISPKKHRLPSTIMAGITHLEQTNASSSADHLSFSEDDSDARLIPYQVIARCMRHAVTTLTRNNKLYCTDAKGSIILRKAILNMLNMEIGLSAELDNICILRGSQMGLFLAARLLIEEDDCIVVEQLSSPIARETFKNSGANLLYVAHNESGIHLESLEKLCINQPVRAIYVTPHHQIPTGAVMSMDNRKGLLKLAQRYNFVIIEDASGSEFSYTKDNLRPLIQLDKSGRVIYISSFSKILAPGFRVGYMVAPTTVIKHCASDITLIDRQGNALVEHAVAELLESGEIKRHITKSIKIYQARKTHLTHLIESELAEFCTLSSSNSGLGLWIDLAPHIQTDLILKDAEKQKLKLYYINQYSEHCQVSGLRLGFAHLNLDEITLAVEYLKNTFMYQSAIVLRA